MKKKFYTESDVRHGKQWLWLEKSRWIKGEFYFIPNLFKWFALFFLIFVYKFVGVELTNMVTRVSRTGKLFGWVLENSVRAKSAHIYSHNKTRMLVGYWNSIHATVRPAKYWDSRVIMKLSGFRFSFVVSQSLRLPYASTGFSGNFRFQKMSHKNGNCFIIYSNCCCTWHQYTIDKYITTTAITIKT